LLPKKVKFTKNKNYFTGLKPAVHNLQNCRFCVVPLPFEKTTTYGRGTKNGPRAVIEASAQLELYDEELKISTYKKGIYTHKPVNCKAGIKTVFKRIETAAAKILKSRTVPFFIGGEHSISQVLISTFSKKYKNLSVLHFDAHADLREIYEKSPHSHACAMSPASKKCRVVQVGIRSIAEEEVRFVNRGNVKTFLMNENLDIEKLIPKVLKNLSRNVYISIDVDGFDPSVIPATGTPVPGGFLWYDALQVVKKVCRSKNIAGVDVVELSPVKNLQVSEFTVAKLIYRLMGYIFK
jgi:agmatinase